MKDYSKYSRDPGETHARRRLANYNDKLAEVVEKQAKLLHSQSTPSAAWHQESMETRMEFRKQAHLARLDWALKDFR